ncbi:M1 family aminopeptidase [Flavobacterium sp.]|jgi:ABC-2 type transport system permease protein|uniref:ABC transporter permease/M1 family aminopeptidase n=1 Tax=Flavobacterium sp. TaxID=239 RepID=UPI0037BEE6E0
MFGTLFTFELKRWLKNPTFYIFCGIFFALSLFLMASSLGVFDSFKTTTVSNTYSNSPIAINSMLNGLSLFIYFLLPTIVGASVYRDFKYNMHTILFSYPFTKSEYMFGKFLSSITVVILITFCAGLGSFAACFLPSVNPDLLGPHKFSAYWQSYLIFIIPNILFYGVIIFSVVTITRNVVVGFISVIGLFFIQGILGNFTEEAENKYLISLFDPFGSDALNYYTKYWTVFEKNANDLPFEGALIYNRLIWFGISLLIFALIYRSFSFSQTAPSWQKSKNEERVVKNNFGSITRINLPKISFDFSFVQQLKTAWSLSNVDFKFMVKNWIFVAVVIVGLLFAFITLNFSGTIFGTETYPVTWQMLQFAGGVFSTFINLMTFLFAGIIIHRVKNTRMNFLIDATPTKNWTFLLSKLIAIVKMQMILLSIVLVSGIIYQASNGFFDFEIGHYLFELYVLILINCVVWALLAVFIQSLLKNYLLGFFILMILSIGLSFLPIFGIEQQIFVFNSDTGYSYSDMNGYGHRLNEYFLYKTYWLLLGIVMFIISLLFYVRGLGQSVRGRISDAKKRLTKPLAMSMLIAFVGFISIGSTIYYYDNIKNENKTGQEVELEMVNWEKKYKKYQNTPQPRIIAINVALDLYPKERNYVAKGTYILKNKSSVVIDTIFVDYMKKTKLDFNTKVKLVSKDTVYNFNIYRLEKPLQPGETITLNFELKNDPNTILEDNSPVLENGTFLNNQNFPRIGYNADVELTDDDLRKKYGLKPKDRMPFPTDSIARQNTYISNDSDWIKFETTVSTAGDQIAIAPGYLQKQWKKEGRNYFHYKMDRPMLNFYAYNSARYEVKRDKWNDVNIEIYYHKGHHYNVGRMISAIKKSLGYYTKNFSPYQHKQVRVIEFPNTMGMFAQSFANTIPFSEAIGFIAAVDDENPDAVDYPFSVTSHEVAHQWFAHQVIGANVQGATLLSESLSEYSSLKVLEHTYGKSQMRRFLKDALDKYLQGRTFESDREQPLMFNENQQYIHYNKGSLVLYALSDYIGEQKMNNAIKAYIQKVAYQEAPYTNSIEFVSYLNQATPDSLKYVIDDMFKTITLYDNKITKAFSKKLKNGSYEVTINFDITKYKANEEGKRTFTNNLGKTLKITKKGKKYATESYPLNDYIEIGIFSEETLKNKKRDKELYLKKVKVTGIENQIKLIVKEKPLEVGVDPYNKLIDTQSDDNRMKI